MKSSHIKYCLFNLINPIGQRNAIHPLILFLMPAIYQCKEYFNQKRHAGMQVIHCRPLQLPVSDIYIAIEYFTWLREAAEEG